MSCRPCDSRDTERAAGLSECAHALRVEPCLRMFSHTESMCVAADGPSHALKACGSAELTDS